MALVKKKLNSALDLSAIKEIPADGLREHRDIPYQNRAGKELLMLDLCKGLFI